MSLSRFILANSKQIASEWEAFARTLPDRSQTKSLVLRDHIEPMLQFIAADMETAQSPNEQTAKSQGRKPRVSDHADSAAQMHGAQRLDEGFDLNEMVSEYRALRASVLRLWKENNVAAHSGSIEEIGRFNEAVDQLIEESVQRYTELVDRSRNLVLGVLSHDLRNPLSAVLLSSAILRRAPNLTATSTSALKRIEQSTLRMRGMVSDLLDFTRTNMGTRLPLQVGEADLEKTVDDIVDELRSIHPDRIISTEMSGNPCGRWDAARLGQLLSNLIGNAIHHGRADSTVHVKIVGDGQSVTIFIHNDGPTVSERDAKRIFTPLIRGLNAMEADATLGSIGLGLFVTREIAVAHGGTVEMTSSDEEGTTFIVKLPREA